MQNLIETSHLRSLYKAVSFVGLSKGLHDVYSKDTRPLMLSVVRATALATRTGNS